MVTENCVISCLNTKNGTKSGEFNRFDNQKLGVMGKFAKKPVT